VKKNQSDTSDLESFHGFQYIHRLEFADPEILKRLERTPPSTQALSWGKRFSKKIREGYTPPGAVRFVSEKTGYGFFSGTPLPKGAFAGEYLGVVCANNRHSDSNGYLHRYPVLDDIGRSFVIDAKPKSNVCRFYNHSYRPNLKPVVAFSEGLYHAIFVALRPIQQGEQLCFNYGQAYWYIRHPPEEF